MKNNETFKMTYSATEQEEIDQIRKKYVPREMREEDKMTKLRALDGGVTKKATIYSVTVGVVGALVMGAGMSMIMTDFGKLFGGAAFPVGIVAGSIGIVIAALAYPLYNSTLKKEREKIAPEVLKLTEELMK